MTESSDYNIVVKVDPTLAQQGLGEVKSELGGIESTLTTLAQSVGLYELGHQALDLVESYEKVQNRLRNLTEGEEELRSTTAALFQVAEQTRGTFNATAEVYSRLARANQEVGFSQAQLLQVTKALNEEAVIQGRTSEDLSGIVGQLSIALQTGTLNARALRLIFRDFPDVAAALEQQLGATSREFKTLGQEGKISGEEIFKALLGASEVLDQKFAKTIPTVSQAMVDLRTHFQEFLSTENESLGITSLFSQAVEAAAQHVNVLTGALAALGVLLGAEVGVKLLTFASNLAVLQTGTAAVAAPFAAIGFIAAGVSLKMVQLGRDIEKANEDLSGLAQLTSFGQLGEQVAFLTEKVRSLKAAVAANPEDVRANQLLQQYTEELKSATEGYEHLSESKKKAAAFDQLIVNETKNLEEQVRILQLGNKEREVQTKLLELTQKLQASGIALTADQKDELAGRIRNVQALTDMAKVLTDLRGPQEEYSRRVQLATELLVAGTLTQEEYNRVLRSGGLEGQLDALQKETDLLRFNAQQREIVIALRQAEKAVGHELSGQQALEIVQAVQTKQALSEQAKLLEEINGPQAHYAERVAALNVLLEKGKISIEDYNLALASRAPQGPALPPENKLIEDTAGLKPTTGPLADTLAKMQQENELLVLNNEQRTLATALLRAQDSVGRELTQDEIAQVTRLTEAHVELTDQLQGEAEARKTVASIQQEILNNLQGPQAHLAGVQTQLNVLFRQGKISLDEYSRGLLQVDLAARQTDTSLEGGLARGFDKIRLQVSDVGTTVESTLVGAFNSANEALDNFVKTGKFSFDAFAAGILSDIAKIALQMAESNLLGALFPAGGGANFGLSPAQLIGGFTGFAEGGDFSGNEPFIAGERGKPELVVPRGPGTVLNGEQTRNVLSGAAAPRVSVQPPQVHVHITNVDDPDKVTKALATREGEKTIMNVISRNKDAIRRSLQ